METPGTKRESIVEVNMPATENSYILKELSKGYPLRTDLFLGRTRGAPATTEGRNDRATDIGEVSVGEGGTICAGV
jgi:hypothetical protein